MRTWDRAVHVLEIVTIARGHPLVRWRIVRLEKRLGDRPRGKGVVMRRLAMYLASASVLFAGAGCGGQDAGSSSDEASPARVTAAYTTTPQTVPSSPDQVTAAYTTPPTRPSSPDQLTTPTPPVSYVSTRISDFSGPPVTDGEGHELIGWHGIPADDAAEQTLHQILVYYHASDEVADCIVTEAFAEPPKRMPGNPVDTYSFTAEDFAEYAAQCEIEINDLWTYPGD